MAHKIDGSSGPANGRVVGGGSTLGVNPVGGVLPPPPPAFSSQYLGSQDDSMQSVWKSASSESASDGLPCAPAVKPENVGGWVPQIHLVAAPGGEVVPVIGAAAAQAADEMPE